MTTRRSSRRLSTASAKQQLDHLAAAAMDASADNILYRTPNATPDKEILQAHADKEKAEQDGQNQQLEKLVAKEGSAETEVESVVNAPSPPASPAPLHPPPPPPPTAAADVSANRKQLQQENPDLTVESVLANVATELEKAVEMKEEEQKMESNPSVSETHQVQQQQATQLENAPPSSSSNEVHISLDFPQHKTVSIEAAAAILSPPPIAYTANNSSGIYDPLAATNIQHQINPSTTLPQYHTAPAAIHHGLPHHNQQHNAHPHHHHLQQQQHIHRPPHHDIYNIDAASGFVDMSGIPMGARSNSYFDSPATSSTDRDSWLSNGSPFMDSPHNQNHHHYSPHHHHQHPHHPHRAMSLPHNQQQMR